MPSSAVSLLIDGILQTLISVIVFATLYKRGRNASLRTLGLVLGVMGLLSFLAAFADIKMFAGETASEVIMILTYHLSAFICMAIFIATQVTLIMTPTAARKACVFIFSTTVLLLIIHLLPLGIFHPSARLQSAFYDLENLTMIAFFVAALVFIGFINVRMLVGLLRSKNGAPDYTTNTWLGIELLFSALIIRKTIDLMPSYQNIDLLPMVVLILAVAGFVLQISFMATPGIIYDSVTKKAVPLALVHVYANQRMAASAASRDDGRYALFLMPGEYEMKISAIGYKFPSESRSTYHGEKVKMLIPGVLSLDIALDPIVS